jgi:hypothetical protein
MRQPFAVLRPVDVVLVSANHWRLESSVSEEMWRLVAASKPASAMGPRPPALQETPSRTTLPAMMAATSVIMESATVLPALSITPPSVTALEKMSYVKSAAYLEESASLRLIGQRLRTLQYTQAIPVVTSLDTATKT